MKIAIPTAGNELCMHFGHCEAFAVYDVNPDTETIISVVMETPPPHEPGLLPKWIAGLGVNTVIAGGMGMRAQQLFAENNIKIITGVQGRVTDEIVKSYMSDTLTVGANTCDH